MKKILLVVPPFYRLMGSHYNGLHLGIAYIAAVLREAGHEAVVYNADFENRAGYLNQRQLFDSFTSYKDILNDPSHPIWREIEAGIAGFGPDLLGITMLTANYKAAGIIAGIAKKLDAACTVVVGGTHPTIDPDGTLEQPDFDYVVRGEGEQTVLELAADRDPSGIPGLSYRRDGAVIHNSERPFITDLASLPFPNREAFLGGTEGMDLNYVMTGRGCPFSCAYCVSPQFWHREVRFRPVDDVIEELALLKEKYDARLVRFVDDTFTLNRDRAKEICQAMIDRRFDLEWVCDTRADCLDRELVHLMKQAGCVRIKIGVESGSERILKNMDKRVTKERIRQAVENIKAEGIPLTVYLMIGFPGETDAELQQTIDFAKEIEAEYNSLSILSPYFGTRVWRDMVASGKEPDREHWEYFYHQSREMLLNDGLSPALVGEFFELDEQGKGKRV